MTTNLNPQQPYAFESEATPSGAASATDIRSKLSGPAITMVVLAALGIAWSLYGVVSSLFIVPQVSQMTQQMGEMTEQIIQEDMRRMERQRAEAAQASGSEPMSAGPPADSRPPVPDIGGLMQAQNAIMQNVAKVGTVYSVLGVAFNGLILFGAISMLNVQRYVLAVTASVLMMLPVTSPCCLIGLPVGIWALVTLTRPGVSEAFRGTPISAGM
ncbi:MAG: hypothetical protein ACKO2P_17630 [Planctomycetota bacterium]